MILTFTEASAKFGLSTSLKREYEIYIENIELMRIAEIMGIDFYNDVNTSPSNYTNLLPYIKNLLERKYGLLKVGYMIHVKYT